MLQHRCVSTLSQVLIYSSAHLRPPEYFLIVALDIPLRMTKVNIVTTGCVGGETLDAMAPNRMEINDFVKNEKMFSLYIQSLRKDSFVHVSITALIAESIQRL